MTTPYIKLDALVYKTRRGVPYHVDAFLPEKQGAVGDTKGAPVVVFFHGGGMVAGSREENPWFPYWLLEDSIAAGFVFLSADYTLLAPYTAGDIVQDVKDLSKWIQWRLNEDLKQSGRTAVQVDPERTVVVGASSGGAVAYYAGLYAEPKPKAVLGIYAVGGDLLCDTHVAVKTKPFFQFRCDPLPLLPSGDAYAPFLTTSVADTPPTTGTPVDEGAGARGTFGMWLMQTGTYLDVLTGIQGLGAKLGKLEHGERAQAVPQDARALIPSLAVADGNAFPPTLLVHGVDDTCIRIAESRNFHDVLTKVGVESTLIEVPDADHGFDFASFVDSHKAWLKSVVPLLSKYARA